MSQELGDKLTMAIKAGIFDLDGTLYFEDSLGREIGRVAALYISRLKGIDPESARVLIRTTRKRLTAEQGLEASLSIACQALGGDLRELHDCFSEEIDPEPHLVRDEAVIATLGALAAKFPLYIYTNNNLPLSVRIMDLLGVSNLFAKVFTIESFWRAKPDPENLNSILDDIGRKPSECLFVGDRYDIDLRLPEKMGAKVHLVSNREDFITLNKYL
jgi:putative hydrolase of the HAD superfamily